MTNVEMSVSCPELPILLCLVDDNLKRNEQLKQSIHQLNVDVTYSINDPRLEKHGSEFIIIWILAEFDGVVFTNLRESGHRILSPTVVMQYANKKQPLPKQMELLFTTSMSGLSISFGSLPKEEKNYLKYLIKVMGAHVSSKDYKTAHISHLVALHRSRNSDIFKYAILKNIPIMTPQWIHALWDRRDEVSCDAANEEFMQYRLLPFLGCKIALVGYQKGEEEHMTEVVTKNGGEITKATDSSCTHIVAEDGYSVYSSEFNRSAYIVKLKWFEDSIENWTKMNEMIYLHQIAVERFSTNTKEISVTLQDMIEQWQACVLPNDVPSTMALIEEHTRNYNVLKEDLHSAVRHGKTILRYIRRPSEDASLDLCPDKLLNVEVVARLLKDLNAAGLTFQECWIDHEEKLQQHLKLKFEEAL